MRFTLKIWRHASYSLATHHYAAGTSYEKLWHESSHHQALAVFSFPAPKEPGYLFLYLDVWDPSRRIWAIDLKELYTCQLATPRSETWPHSDLPFKISLKTAIFTDIARQRPTRLVIELQTKKKKKLFQCQFTRSANTAHQTNTNTKMKAKCGCHFRQRFILGRCRHQSWTSCVFLWWRKICMNISVKTFMSTFQ